MSTFDEWLEIGRGNGWVSEPTCAVHGLYDYLNESERDAYDAGNDPCLDALFLIGSGE